MIVLDSDIIIWILRGDKQLTEQFKSVIAETDGNVFITPIQIAEIYAGMLPKEKTLIDNFMSSLPVIIINEKTGKLAGEFMNKYAKSHNVTLSDAMVAASARSNDCEIWTMNKKHYPMLESDEFFQK